MFKQKDMKECLANGLQNRYIVRYKQKPYVNKQSRDQT